MSVLFVCLLVCLFVYISYVYEWKMYYNEFIAVNPSMKVLYNHIITILYSTIMYCCWSLCDMYTSLIFNCVYLQLALFITGRTNSLVPACPRPTCVYMHVLISVTRIAKLPDRPASLTIHFQHVAQHGRDCSPMQPAQPLRPPAPRVYACMKVESNWQETEQTVVRI